MTERNLPTLSQVRSLLTPKQIPKWVQSVSQLIQCDLKETMVVEPDGAFFAPSLLSVSGVCERERRVYSVMVSTPPCKRQCSVQSRLDPMVIGTDCLTQAVTSMATFLIRFHSVMVTRPSTAQGNWRFDSAWNPHLASFSSLRRGCHLFFLCA